jgi:conjugal transfer ATP-binding protein TraC
MLDYIKRFATTAKERMCIDGICESDIDLMVQRNKFSNYLPYRAYNNQDRFYTNCDDSTGFLWEIQPLVYASEETHTMIEGIFNTVPMGSVIQVMLYADQNIEHIIEHYLSLRENPHQTNRTIALKTAELFNAASRNGFEKIAQIPARRFRAFFAVKLVLKEGFTNDARYLRDAIHETLKGCGLLPRYMPPQILCQTLQRIFNDQDDVPGTWHYNDQQPINKQIIMGGTRILAGFNHITIGTEKKLHFQTIKEYPKESLDDLTMNRIIGGFEGPKDDGNQCNMPLWVSVNIVVDDLRHMFHGKSTMMMQQHKKGSGAGFKMDRQNEMLWATQQADRGERFVRVIPSIITFSKTEKAANKNTARVKSLWENQGFSVNKDRGILAPLFLLSLPFGLYKTKNNIEFLERDRIMPIQSAARMLPLQGDFCGCGKPVTLFLGRKGQTVPIDLYHPMSENFNAIITATSGSGKSYLMNRLLTDQLSTGVIARVFDIGRSYEKLTQIQDGKFICFSRDAAISVNPYTTIRNIDEEIGILSLIISQMVWSSSKDKPSETQMTIIKTAARQVWDDYGADGEIDHVKRVLQDFKTCLKRQAFELEANTDKIKDSANELAFNLSDFTGNGPYARWFKGKSTLDISSDRFVVLELEELIAMQELFNVVIMQVVNSVTQNLYLSDRQNPRTIVFDEAWKWFKEESFLGEVVENGYRLARKYYGSFITVFQSMLDLKRFGKSGHVLNENSAYKFFLMAKTKYDRIVEEKLIDLDPFMLQIANSVRLEKGRYSEFLVRTPLNTGVARLPVDNFSHMVFTSDARENAVINKISNELGISKVQAIEAMCSEAN